MLPFSWFFKHPLLLWTIHFTSLVPRPGRFPAFTSGQAMSFLWRTPTREVHGTPQRVTEESSVKGPEVKAWAGLGTPARHGETPELAKRAVFASQASNVSRRSRCGHLVRARRRPGMPRKQQPLPEQLLDSGKSENRPNHSGKPENRPNHPRKTMTFPDRVTARNHRKETTASLLPLKSHTSEGYWQNGIYSQSHSCKGFWKIQLDENTHVGPATPLGLY